MCVAVRFNSLGSLEPKIDIIVMWNEKIFFTRNNKIFILKYYEILKYRDVSLVRQYLQKILYDKS